MSRTDGNKLNVPDFPKEPKEDSDHSSAAPVESQMESILEGMDKASTLKQQSNRCSGCKGTMSDIEKKMGRCFTCGKTVEDTNAEQDAAPKSPKFEVRI